MQKKYVPILRYKRGELDALLHLDEKVKDNIIPLIEIPLSALKSLSKKPINCFWNDRPFFFYFSPEWYTDDDGEEDEQKNAVMLSMCNNIMGTPVIDLTYLTSDNIQKWKNASQNGLCIWLRGNEFAAIEEQLNMLFGAGGLNRNNTDLLLDLQYCFSDSLLDKTYRLKAAFSDLDRASEYRSIIIASCSFPKQLPPMDNNKIYRFQRFETEIYTLALKLSNRFGFNYIYSDYGPNSLEDIQYIQGMSPNFKIKYTTLEHYVYIKGLQIKRGGLDIGNVRALCKILMDSGEFSGENYSWGDNKMYQLAQEVLNSPGNLTTWVSYAMNHHITLMTKIL